MKKLRLKALSLGAREILSREQLRGITGGCVTNYDCNFGHGECNIFGECEYPGGGGSGSSASDDPSQACPDSSKVRCCCNGECHSMLDCDIMCIHICIT